MTFGPAGAGVGVSIPNPLAILNGAVGVGASLPGIGAGLGLGGGGAGAGVNVGGGGGGGWGANGQQNGQARAGLGVNVGGGVNGQQNGQAVAGLGVNVGGGGNGQGGGGAELGVNVGGGANGQGQVQGQGGGNWGGQQQGGVSGGANVGGGLPSVSGSVGGGGNGQASQGGNVGGGVGDGVGGNGAAGSNAGGSANGGGRAQASPEASAGLNGNAGGSPPAPGASAGLGVNGNSGGGNSAAGNSRAGIGLGGGLGGGAGLMLGPLPGVQAAPVAGHSSPCTVMGGQARLLYFPPGGNGGSEGGGSPAVSNRVGAQPPGSTITTAPAVPPAQGAPVPAGGQPLTAFSNTFNPDYCYLSVDTLYATIAPSGTEAASTVGPTFSNAIIPLRSSDISTLCPSSMPGAATPTAALTGAQIDFNSMASSPAGGSDLCHGIAAPAAMGSIVPEWNNGLFWHMNFQPPQVLQGPDSSTVAPGCSACASPQYVYSPASTPYPTMVQAPGYQGVNSGPTTAPDGVSPSSFGAYTASSTPAATTGAVGGYAPPAPSAGWSTGIAANGTSPVAPTTGSPTSPAQYTGGAVSGLNIRGGRGLSLVAGLLLTLAFM